MNNKPIHPKVAWPAIATLFISLVEGVLAWQHVTIPPPVVVPAVGLIAAFVGYLAPSPDASTSAPSIGNVTSLSPIPPTIGAAIPIGNPDPNAKANM